MKKFYGCCSLTSFLLWLILKKKRKKWLNEFLNHMDRFVIYD